jgi:hypothetical protein
MTTPADAIVFQDTAHPVVRDGAALKPDATASAEARREECLERRRAAVGKVRPNGLPKVPIRCKGAQDRFDVADVSSSLETTDDITCVRVPGLENRWPEVTLSVDRPLAAVGAEHHRAVIGRFGDNCYRPSQWRPVVARQMGPQFHHRPTTDDGGGHGLNTGVTLGQARLILADESPELPMATDLASFGRISPPRQARHPPERERSLCRGRRSTAPPDQPDLRPESDPAPAAAALAKSGNHGISTP